MLDMRDAIYREWIPAGLLVKSLVGIVFSAFLVLLFVFVATSLFSQNLFWIVIPVFTMAFLGLLFWNYRGIEIQISDEELQVNYGIFNHKTILLENIVSCELAKASFRKYGGVGIRFGIDGSWAYTTSFGNAVKIIPQKGRPFVFSSKNPREICDLISQTKSVA